MKLTVTSGRFKVWDLEQVELSDAELEQALSTYEIGDKDGEALIPALFNPCPAECHNHKAAEAAKKAGSKKPKFDCGGGAQHRLNVNVGALTGLGIDLDHLSADSYSKVIQHLQASGLECYVWETHSHAPPDDNRARVLFPFSEELPLTNPAAWSKVAWPALVKAVGLDQEAATDQHCKDPSRVYYLPRKPSEDAEREAVHLPGKQLDWRAVLGDSLNKIPAKPETAPPPAIDPTRAVDLDDVRERLSRVNTSNKALIRRVLAGKSPTPPPGQREKGDPPRYTAWLKVTGVLAHVAHDWEDTNALLEVLRPAYTASVQDDPQDHTPWETIEQLFEHGRADVPAIRAQRKAEREAAEEVFRRAMAKARPAAEAKPPDTGGPKEPKENPPKPSAEAVEGNWAAGLVLDMKPDGPQVRNCAANVTVILFGAPEWRDVLRYNQVTKNVEMHGGPVSQGTRLVTDSDAVEISKWFAQKNGIHQSDGVIWARMMAVARANAYDPLMQYLEGLTWDGRARLDTWLSKYLGAEGEFASKAGRRWMIAGAARGLNPGCQVDSMLILEGLQGAGKTTAARILGGPFFKSESITFGAKDSLISVASAWVFELGELDSLRKAEVTQQKQFLSKTYDDFRAPYGRVDERHHRRAIFLGTTNTDDYLHDETGNRRYWPVGVQFVNREGLTQDRDQLWAEAVHLYQEAETCDACAEAADGEARCAEHRWWFGRAESGEVAQETDQRMAADSVAETVERHILTKAKDRRPETLRTADVLEMLGETPGRSQEMRIAKSLRRLGFKRVRVMENGQRRWVYETPKELLEAGVVKEQSPAMRVAQAQPQRVSA